MPGSWPLRVGAFDAQGRPQTGEPVAQDVAGPCCFAGDVVAENRELPALDADDLVVLYDTGAYYFSTPWAYNSLPRPAVHGYVVDGTDVRFAPVRDAQTLDEIAAESGARHADRLLDLAPDAPSR